MERGGIHDGVVVSAPFHMRQELGNDKAAWRRNDMLLEGKPTEVVHLLEGLVRGVEPGDVGLHPAPGTGVCVAGGLELLAGKFAEVVPVIFRIQQKRAVRGVSAAQTVSAAENRSVPARNREKRKCIGKITVTGKWMNLQ